MVPSCGRASPMASMRVADEVEHDLLQLDAVAENGGQILVEFEVDGGSRWPRLRGRKDQRVLEHRADVEGADMRLAAPQEVTHAPHDAAGMVDLRDQAGQIAVGAAGVGIGLRARAAAPNAPRRGPPSSAD